VMASHHADGLLCLDELTLAAPREIGDMILALGNGSSKQRLTQNTGPASSRCLFLATGESSLDDHMASGGKQVLPGHEVRLSGVRADAGKGLGLFECIYDFPNPSAFARYLGDAVRRNYGTPIQEFLRMVVKDREAATQTVIEHRDQFLKRHVPTEASGEVRRAASRFALVAAAGELATAAGITGWPEHESMSAAQVCFGSWLGRRGATGFRPRPCALSARCACRVRRDGATPASARPSCRARG